MDDDRGNIDPKSGYPEDEESRQRLLVSLQELDFDGESSSSNFTPMSLLAQIQGCPGWEERLDLAWKNLREAEATGVQANYWKAVGEIEAAIAFVKKLAR